MAKTYAQKTQEDWERENSGHNVAVQMSDRNNARNERRRRWSQSNMAEAATEIMSNRGRSLVQEAVRNNATNERRMHRMINSSVYGKNEQKSSGGNKLSEKSRGRSDTRETIEKAFRNSGRIKLKK